MKCIEDEIPFEVPKGWAWCRLNALSENITDGDHQPPPQTKYGIPFLVISNVSDGNIHFENTRYVSEEYYNQLSNYRKAQKGDLLFTVTGSYGIPIVVDTETPFCFQRHIAIIRPCVISNTYLSIVLGSMYIRKQCDELSTGTAQKTVGLTMVRNFLIPVPPFVEQSAIIEKAKEALSLTARIQANKDSLAKAIARVKSKVLDLAIRGKLVPQNPNDEPASVLLERIRSEKEELIKQGKIKRNKKESIIFKGEDNSYYEKISDSVTCIDDELPFEIPNNWCWARLSSISVNYDNYRKPINATERKKRIADKEKDKLYPYFGATGQVGFIDDFLFNGEYILLGEDAAPFLDKTAQKAYMVSGKIWVNNHVHILESLILSEYLLHSLNSVDYLNYVYGTTRLKLTQENMNKILLPIPPIKEQTKLCQVISNANSFIKSIEASLN